MLPKKAKLGIVGVGAIAQSYIQSLQDCDSAELVGVADVRDDAVESVSATTGCVGAHSVDELVKSTALDAVIVCTPPATHPDICVSLFEHGIPVLCEKPLAIDSISARRMLSAATAAGVKLSMASKFRHVDDVIRARAIVSSGIIGDILLFENVFAGHVDMSTRWNSDAKISGGGVLIDNGTHSVDIMRYFLGPLAELRVFEGRRVQGLEVEDTVRMFIRTHSGVLGSIDLSWSMNKEQPYYISIYGAQGTILVGWKESKYRRSQDDEWIVFGKGYDKVDAFRQQIINFVGAIQGEAALVVTPEDALASVQTIEAAYQAMENNPWNPIGSSDDIKLASTS